MKEWEVARYLIDAKKDIDSIIYFSENLEKIPLTIRKEYCDRIRDHFYINCCVVIDAFLDIKNIYNTKEEKFRSNWKSERPIIERLYYERDKNSAHIDKNYKIKEYESLTELKNEMIRQIKKVFEISKDILPNNIDLKFLSHDKVLFRLINGIDAKKEEKIRESMYSDKKGIYSKAPYGKALKAVYDIKEVRGISEEEKQEIGVATEIGLNYFETIQNIQDFFIKINLIYGLNYWTDFFDKQYPKYMELKNSGVIDIYDRPKSLHCYTRDFIKKVSSLATEIYGKNIFKQKS